MKKNMLLGGLVLYLLFGFSSCDDGSNSDDGTLGRTVDPKYCGEYWGVRDNGWPLEDYNTVRKLIIREKEIIFTSGGSEEVTKDTDITTLVGNEEGNGYGVHVVGPYSAWTQVEEDFGVTITVLMYIKPDTIGEFYFGTLEDENTVIQSEGGTVYIYKRQ